MSRWILALTVAGLALAVGPPAGAADKTVVVADFSFTQKTVTVVPGDTVTWDFQNGGHTTTSDQGFWDSGLRSAGDTFARRFTSSGSYGYHCIPHQKMGMVGTVRVIVRAAGSSARGWTLRWSTGTAPAGRDFDVQFRRRGVTTWSTFRSNTHQATGLFNPARSATYQVRARTSNTVAGASTGWSPVRSLVIT